MAGQLVPPQRARGGASALCKEGCAPTQPLAAAHRITSRPLLCQLLLPPIPKQDDCDYVDLNLGCPQRIAKKGFYGAYLMDDLDLVARMVARAAAALRVPVSCKIRLFPDLQQTIAYARILEASGCSLLGVHGRTREMKVRRVVCALGQPMAADRDSMLGPRSQEVLGS
jgi:hypothetical protein